MTHNASHYRYIARVAEVYPPRPVSAPSTFHNGTNAEASTSSSPLPDEEKPIHKIAEDLNVLVTDSVTRDDPAKYYYKVQILEEDKQSSSKSHEKQKGKEARQTWSGSLMDVQCPMMRCISPNLSH